MHAESQSLAVINYSSCAVCVVYVLEVSIVVTGVLYVDSFFNDLLHLF
jgi:hypothetical protein